MGSVRTEDDENFEVWNQKKTLNYDSPQIQNKIINIMTHEIVRGIAKEVREAELFFNSGRRNYGHKQ